MLRDVRWIDIRSFQDDRGSLSVIEGASDIPFEIRRIYYLYHSRLDRGHHAHKRLQQLFIAIHGNVTLMLDDGSEKATFVLNQPNRGLYIPPGIWREIRLDSEAAVGLVLASEKFDEAEYIRTYSEFKDFVAQRG